MVRIVETSIAPPDASIAERARIRLDALAIPRGALGRLGDLAVWLSASQGQIPPVAPARIRAVVFAGDHGIARSGVSAYPAEITPMMVRAFCAGTAGVNVLARQHGVALRVLDIAVDADLGDLGEAVVAHKIRRGSGSIDREDALTAEETETALAIGRRVADEELAAGADLLLSGDMGIGNTTVAAALIAGVLGLSAAEVAGRGTGIDDATLAHKTAVIDAALTRAGSRVEDPVELLGVLGSADIAATVGYLSRAAECGVPVLLDGAISVAAALVAERLTPGAAAWFTGGHRSTEPAQSRALAELGIEPLLDLDLRLGEGSGAVAAVPLLRSAALLLGEIALLDDVIGAAVQTSSEPSGPEPSAAG